jgi:hypothetical protein
MVFPPSVGNAESGAFARAGRETRMMSTRSGRSALALLVAVGAAVSGAAAAAEMTIHTTYSIAISGFPIGKADANTRIQGSGYSVSINGFTSGLTRIVSDATAQMESFGRVSGRHVMSGGYTLESKENGESTNVRMKLNSGSVTSVSASPPLKYRPNRVPVTASTLQNVVDPVSAFIVPAGPGAVDGPAACNRTVKVFDGWSRFDIRLSFKENRKAEGDTGPASKTLFVCAARFVPVAGHVPDAQSVKFMTENRNLEIWLASVTGTEILIPYRIQVGTMSGELTVRATSISTGEKVTKASAQ